MKQRYASKLYEAVKAQQDRPFDLDIDEMCGAWLLGFEFDGMVIGVYGTPYWEDQDGVQVCVCWAEGPGALDTFESGGYDICDTLDFEPQFDLAEDAKQYIKAVTEWVRGQVPRIRAEIDKANS